MRLSGLSLTAVLLFSSFMLAQHSSSSSSSGSSSSSSSGSGSHSSSSGGSSYSGGGSGGGSSHSSGGGYSSSGGSTHSAGGSSHSEGGSHSWGGGHTTSVHNASGSSHAFGGASVSNATAVRSKTEHGNSLVTSRNGIESTASKVKQTIREPKPGDPQHVIGREKRSFFSFLRHPFRKPQPTKVVAQPALYLPRPCLKGRCFPVCPVGQVSSGGVCVVPPVSLCVPGQTVWNGISRISCGYSASSQCSAGEIWNGSACIYQTRFWDNCFALRRDLNRQEQRVQAAESLRRSACANGPVQECSEATASWQNQENSRQGLLALYQQCRMRSFAANSAGFGLTVYDSTPWFDYLRFDLRY